MPQMNDAVIVDAVRTPIGKKNGSLANWRPDDLAAETIKTLVDRNKLDPSLVDDVVLGCVTQVNDQAWNIARNAALAASLPISVPGTTVNRLCASSLQACNFASQVVKSGDMNLVIAGGVESMTRIPMGSDAGTMSPKILDRFDLIGQGISAEMIAEKWQFSRQQIDEFSLRSHEKALRFNANKIGPDSISRTPHEILGIDIGPGTRFIADEGPRISNMVGILVAVTKLVDMASVIPGLALWAFAGLIVVLAGAMASLDPEAVWERLEVRR